MPVSNLIRICLRFGIVIITILALAGCDLPWLTPSQNPNNSNNTGGGYTPPALPQAQVTFQVQVPLQTPKNQKIGVEILDDVSGISIDSLQSKFNLDEKGPNLFEAKIPVPVGSVIKYRYFRNTSLASFEYDSAGLPVRYRLLVVAGPMTITDTVNGWNDIPFSGDTGKITGLVTSSNSNAPLPGILIEAAGKQTTTASDGSFILEQIPVGIHNLVAYSKDGTFRPFQQGAAVAAGATTPAGIQLNPSHLVKITFILHAPKTSISGVPVRLIGNISTTGNTFSILEDGTSVVASRAPYMSLDKNGNYSITLSLPAGLDFRYKYTLGNGYINAEHDQNGNYVLRQLIVPNVDKTIEDAVTTWTTKNYGSITYSLTVPDDTPASDSISIQFKTSSRTEPIPMWPLGNHQYIYVLSSPLDVFSNAGYRFCRNDQCGVADDDATKGSTSQGYPFTSSPLSQSLQNKISKWADWTTLKSPTNVVAGQIRSAGPEFMAGIEFQRGQLPSWQSYLPASINTIGDLGANWIIISPTWSYSNTTFAWLDNSPEKDASWQDLTQTIQWAKAKNMHVAVFPQTNFPDDQATWWKNVNKTSQWWSTWQERYRTFILHHADLAAQSNADSLILGEDGLKFLLNPGNAGEFIPQNIDQWFKGIIQEIRGRFKGKILLAARYSGESISLPAYSSEVDEIYILFSAPISKNPAAQQPELTAEISRRLDTDILPISEGIKKPLIIGIDYGSFDGAVMGCVEMNNQCFSFDVLDQPARYTVAMAVDLQEQVDVYNAFLEAINQRTWISGFVSRGYYPPVELRDKSSSIHGKPSSDVLWYWFPRLLAKP